MVIILVKVRYFPHCCWIPACAHDNETTLSFPPVSRSIYNSVLWNLYKAKERSVGSRCSYLYFQQLLGQ